MSTTTSSAGPIITVPYGDCTLQLCPIAAAQVPYDPNLAGNVLCLSLFSFCFVVNAVLGIRYKTWAYMIAMLLGCFLEVLGYVGRVQMHYNPFPQNPFFLYLVDVTIAAIFFTAAIYLTLSRLVVMFGERYSYFRPRTYAIFFISSDFLSLLLQAGGGVMVTMANDFSFEQKGLHIMQAGLILQVTSLVVFSTLCGLFAWTCHRHKDELDECFGNVRMSKRFKLFLYGLSFATIFMLTRCAFRVAELNQGFKGHIWFDEIDYMVLEGGMMSLCVSLLTFCHPGIAFCGRYREASWRFRLKKSMRDARVEQYI